MNRFTEIPPWRLDRYLKRQEAKDANEATYGVPYISPCAYPSLRVEPYPTRRRTARYVDGRFDSASIQSQGLPQSWSAWLGGK